MNSDFTKYGVEFLTILAQRTDTFSEDCLTLNVWTKPQLGDAKKAVLVWIYGGSFESGTTKSSWYNGQALAEQEDIIVVSINYRLNIFGFPGSSNATQNLGLLDQRLALEWVRENIEGFGGDMSRITLFGQSAGAASVDYFSYAWQEDPIVSSFILQSGTIILLGQAQPATANLAFDTIASSLGCSVAFDGKASIDCMRAKSYVDIIDAVVNHNEVAFGPTIDEEVIFSDYLDRSARGALTKRPLLLGTTDYEAGLFEAIDDVYQQGKLYVPEGMGDELNMQLYTCPAATRANISISNHIPTWRYRYFGDFENTKLSLDSDYGAYHGSEIALLFDVFSVGPGIPPSTATEIKIGRYIRGAWTAFAKDPENGLRKYGWPEYTPTSNSLVRLAYDNSMGSNLAKGDQYDICDSTFELRDVASTTSNDTTDSTATSPVATFTSVGYNERVPMGFLLAILIYFFTIRTTC